MIAGTAQGEGSYPHQETEQAIANLTREYLQKKNSKGVNEVVANLLTVCESDATPEVRSQALRSLKQAWSEEPAVKNYLEYLAKVEAARVLHSRMASLRDGGFLAGIGETKPPTLKPLTVVEQQAAARRHDPRRENIENHLRVAQNKNVDQVVRDRAVKELAKYKHTDADVDKFFARLNVPR